MTVVCDVWSSDLLVALRLTVSSGFSPLWIANASCHRSLRAFPSSLSMISATASEEQFVSCGASIVLCHLPPLKLTSCHDDIHDQSPEAAKFCLGCIDRAAKLFVFVLHQKTPSEINAVLLGHAAFAVNLRDW